MSHYIVVENTPNRIATVHLSNCNYLGSSPLQSTASARRSVFDDGLEAIFAAHAAVPSNFGLCGYCLKRFKMLRFGGATI